MLMKVQLENDFLKLKLLIANLCYASPKTFNK